MDRLLSTLLLEMDGVTTHDGAHVVVLGVTERLETLDDAILRPGRLEVKIETDESPCLEDRAEIFEFYLRRFDVEDKIDVMARELAELSSGFHGGDIEAVCRDGAMVALRNSRGVRRSDLKRLIKRRVGSDDLFLK
jgi:ATP-dependent 26S proteasome regulatory subunit